MGKMFDAGHITFLIISAVSIAVILYLATKFIKTKKGKDTFLLVMAILAFGSHISILWYDFLARGSATVSVNILFLVYPCNFVMIILLIISLQKNKNSKLFKAGAMFCFYVGIVGNFGNLLYPIYYLSSGISFNTVKSVASHNFLFIGCVYLVLGGYIKLRLTNIIPYCVVVAIGTVVGLLTSLIFYLTGHPYKDVFYLFAPAIPNTPFTLIVVVPISIVIFGLVGFLAEFKYPKAERSYIKFKVFDDLNLEQATQLPLNNTLLSADKIND
jgi:hypothetical protein